MITPIEIRQHAFKKAFRGYDPDEVNAFLLALSQDWEQQVEAYRTIKEEFDKVQASYNTLKEVEGMLHKTLMQAERSSRDTLENARYKAELRIKEAEQEAREIIRKGHQDRDDLKQEISDLSRRRDQLLMQLQIFLKSQLERLESLELMELPPATSQPHTLREPEKRPVSVNNGQKNGDLFSSGENGYSNGSLVDDIMAEL
jgi:cell division initiation protein